MLVTFLVFFLLASGDLFKRKLVRIIGAGLSEKRAAVETLNQITTQIQRVIKPKHVGPILAVIVIRAEIRMRYFREFSNKSTFQGNAVQISSTINF